MIIKTFTWLHRVLRGYYPEHIVKARAQQPEYINHKPDFLYRDQPIAPRYQFMIAELMGGFAWWWVLWHVFTEPEHLIGRWPTPHPEEWTNEELGIPPDDYEPES